jgi:ABC-type uncharacterized transport system involved in gliding motility auxiliary subunit
MVYAIFGTVMLGFFLLSVLAGDWMLALGHAIPGFGLLIYGAVTGLPQLRDRMGSQAGQRNLWFGSNALGQSLALFAVLATIAFIANRNPIHWDWTESGIHSLSQGSKQVLAQIPADQKVNVYAFFSDAEEARALLDPYVYVSDRLEYQVVDANKSPMLAEKLEVGADRMLVVCSGPCETATASVKTTELTEQKITEAVRSVLSKKRKIYFVIGHDESEPSSQDDNGLSLAGSALGSENIEYTTLLLAQAEKVPDDADAVILAAPSNTIYDRELEMLDAYLKKGGSVLVLADALRGNKLPEQLKRWSIELGSDLIVDQQLQLFGAPTLSLDPMVGDYGEHPITKDMRRRLTMFRLARSVAPAAGADADVTVLATTGPGSFAVSDKGIAMGDQITVDPSKDRKGPIPLAVARTFKIDAPPTPEGHPQVAKPREGRLVVVGDADFAQNRYVSEGANADLFLNMVTWLVGQENFITIDRKLPRASRVRMTEANMKLFSYLGLFLVPEGLLMLGVWNWWRRRRVV